MAAKYHVYASGIDFDTDKDGDWVKADDHETEVSNLKERVEELENRVSDLETTAEALESDYEECKCELEHAIMENERLRKALQEIIDS